MKYEKHHVAVIFLTVTVALFIFVPFLAGGSTGGANKTAYTTTTKGAIDYSKQIAIVEYYVQESMKTFGVPGLAIGFYKDDFTWARGFGFADLENEVKVTPNTRFRMASVNKTMTAVAIMRLVKEGKLNLDDEVQKYVPYFPKKKWPVTIRHLLCHLSGISHYRDYDAEGHIKSHYDTKQAIAIFKDWPLEAEPGTRFNYSSYAYNLLGAVIEGATGKPYGQYMTQNVWLPLDMDFTCMDIADDIIRGRTRGYRYLDGKVKNCEFVDISSRFAAGGILSTVVDMLDFCRGLDKGIVLPQTIQSQMYDAVVTKDGHHITYGLGWRRDYLSGFWNIEHGGGQAGTSTYILRFPGERCGIAVASNLEEHNTRKYALLVARVICGVFHIQPITPSPVEYMKLHQVWHTGLGYFDRHNAPLTREPKDLSAAFAYFNSIETIDKAAQKKIDEGLHPVTGLPHFKIGSFMASSLAGKYGPAKLDDFRKRGAIPFFAAYIDLYKKDTSIPKEFRFTRRLEKLVQRWNKDWQQTWNDETRALLMQPVSVFTQAKEKEKAKGMFKGKKIYPMIEFMDWARELQRSGKVDKGLELLQAAVEIYPRNADVHYALGDFYLEKKLYQSALDILKKATAVAIDKAAARYRVQWVKELIDISEKPIVVPVEILKTYVGDYGPRHVFFEGDTFSYQRDGRPKYRLLAIDSRTFALDGLAGARMRFDADEKGKITKITGLYITGRSDETKRDEDKEKEQEKEEK